MALTAVVVMSPQPGSGYPAQAIPAKDMPPDYNWQPTPQGYEVVPAPVAAPYQPQPPEYSEEVPPGGCSLSGPPGGYSEPSNAPQEENIRQPDDTGSKPGLKE